MVKTTLEKHFQTSPQGSCQSYFKLFVTLTITFLTSLTKTILLVTLARSQNVLFFPYHPHHRLNLQQTRKQTKRKRQR